MSRQRELACNECALKEKTIEGLEAAQNYMEEVNRDFRREVDQIFRHEKARVDRDWLRHPVQTLKNIVFSELDESKVDRRTYKRLQKCFFTRDERKERMELVLKTNLAKFRSDKLEKENIELKRKIAQLTRKVEMLEH